MPAPALIAAIESVPRGRWAVGVSGGADSVALLALLRSRADLPPLHVVHLDHQLRGQASDDDARFVAELARRWNLPCTVARRDQIEPTVAQLRANPSARYRRLRLALFERVVREQALDGVLLAHHADDQAETVLHRLLRGSGAMGLAGMSPRMRIGELVIHRPLLGVRAAQLREYLREIDQPWRIDASNESPRYLRNRLRAILSSDPNLLEAILDASRALGAMRDWVRAHAPVLDETFDVARLASPPSLLAEHSARRWLQSRGVPPDQILPDVVSRLIETSRDAASPARQHFPGRVLVRRRAGKIFVDPSERVTH